MEYENIRNTFIGGALLFTHVSHAGALPNKDVEIDALKRVSHELQVVKEMLVEAKRYQNAGDPNPFLYDEADRDLNLLIMAFDDYIAGRFDPTYQREPLRVEDAVRGDGVLHRE